MIFLKKYIILPLLVLILIIEIILPNGLDIIQKLFSIIASFSLFIALAGYLYKKRQDEILAAIDQISFFRQEIIPAHDRLVKEIRKKDPSFLPSYIVGFDFKKYSKEATSQRKVNELLDADGIRSIFNQQIEIFNMIEEFSLKVEYLNTKSHPSLICIKDAFIKTMEENAYSFFIKRAEVGNTIYSTTFKLYNLWEKEVDRTNPGGRIKAFLATFS